MKLKLHKSMAAESTVINPFDFLTEEIVFLILDHLSDDSTALKSFSLTCKSFYDAESLHRRSLSPLRPDLVLRLLNRRRYPAVTRLDFSLCPRVDDDFLLRTVARLTELRCVGLSGSRFVTAARISNLVAGCRNLTEIDLSNSTELTDSAAAAIAEAKGLEKLSLARCKLVSDIGIGCIAVGCKRLKMISLKWCIHVTDLGIGLVALKCKELRSLDLSYLPITEKCLPQVLKLEYLEELVMAGCFAIDDIGLATLKYGCKTLRAIDLSNCHNISDIGLSSLTREAGCLTRISLAFGSAVTVDVAKSLQSFANLQVVKFDGCLVTCSSMKAIGTWCAMLKEISLSKCSGVTDEGIASLVSKHRELRKLDITCCRKITSASIDYVTSSCHLLSSLRMESCENVTKEAFHFIGHRCLFLEELDVTDNDLDDEGLKSISRCSRLTSLKLGICINITDEGLKHIGMNCTRLKEIDLYRAMGVTDVGMHFIASGCPALELINMAYCDKVSDASLVSLSKCSRLRALEMRGCPCITSAGLAAIAAGCRQLGVLDLKKCFKIDDYGMISLAHFSQNLKQINLSYSSVTDVGLVALASIRRLQNLTILHVTGLTPQGLTTALLACALLKKVKLHSAFKPLLSKSLLSHMSSRGCTFLWRDKPLETNIERGGSNAWNRQIQSSALSER